MIQITLSQAAQIALCTSCPLADCQEGADCCPLVIEQRKLWDSERRASNRQLYQTRLDEMTLEQRQEYHERRRQSARTYRQNMTEAQRAQYNQWHRNRYRRLTAEQRRRKSEQVSAAYYRRKARAQKSA